MRKNTQLLLTDEVRDILSRCTMQDFNLYLPAALSREEYKSIDEVLRLAGASWDRRQPMGPSGIKGAHVVMPDTMQKLEIALENGHIVNVKKLHQQYFTAVETAREIVDNTFSELQEPYAMNLNMPRFRIMEPSAGGGAFADAIREWLNSGLRPLEHFLVCVEIDKELASGLVAKGHNVVCKDFLELKPKQSALCDYIFMNPPFTGGQDMKHVLHAFSFLKPNGKLVAITASNSGKGQNRLHQEFAAFLENYETDAYELGVGAFAEAGTQVNTTVHTIVHPDF